ncbi:MAG TPA: 16S rRNA (uracil(1498)-N(3))-methyltransferase [Methylomirabilota bacterium]|jgi:16S rRNA (uracil1498-N3)-methyltransferase|nr:16S rRNA (uracil(1498)-N(3))-methyltransferase [Methylomirabilota bacterium]
MRRFAIAPERVVDGRVTFDALETRHLARVLRLKPGDTVVASDGAGHDFTVRLDAVRPRAAGTVLGVRAAAAESPLAITLVQGVPKGDKLDTIVRAATELGVARIVPALTARSVVRLAGRAAEARRERWQRVAREAAKQCGRAVVPDVAAPRELAACLDAARDADVALCLWEGDAPALALALADVAPPRRIAILVGPEGGLERAEVDAARARGWRVAGLGSRVLRTETAGPALLAILQSRWGDLGTT